MKEGWDGCTRDAAGYAIEKTVQTWTWLPGWAGYKHRSKTLDTDAS